MAAFRLSRLQKRVLRWLLADERRLGPMVSSSHQALVVALPNAKGNISHSLRRLEAQQLIVVGRTRDGRFADFLYLTSKGREKAFGFDKSYE